MTTIATEVKAATKTTSQCCRMSTPIVAAIFVACVVCATSTPADAYVSSRSCQFNRHMRVENINACRFGWEVDACNNKICTKGPAEVCGGKHMRYGICGEGLMCNNCNRCQGCSLRTFECFDDSHCIRY